MKPYETSAEIERLCREVLKNFSQEDLVSYKKEKRVVFNKISKRYNLSNKTLEHVKNNILQIGESETKYRNGIKKQLIIK